jgi:hypothetical protein
MQSYTPRVKDVLATNGCYYVRPGNGDHDIWYSPITDHKFPVDHSIKSRHTANGVLKQAGLPKRF